MVFELLLQLLELNLFFRKLPRKKNCFVIYHQNHIEFTSTYVIQTSTYVIQTSTYVIQTSTYVIQTSTYVIQTSTAVHM